MTPEQFKAAHHAACLAARRAAGQNWHLRPDTYCWARVPANLVAIRVLGKTRRGRRDIRLPNPEYWADGAYPAIKRDLAAPYPVAAPGPRRKEFEPYRYGREARGRRSAEN